jgi:hypothetical protein
VLVMLFTVIASADSGGPLFCKRYPRQQKHTSNHLVKQCNYKEIYEKPLEGQYFSTPVSQKTHLVGRFISVTARVPAIPYSCRLFSLLTE